METKPELKKMDGISKDLVAERLAQLKATIPEAFAEGKIDFEALRSALGDAVDSSKEHYKFTWNGKEEARAFALRPSMGTLRPCESESKDWATTQNLYIEGDNLEVLKLLQGSYYGQVKMIYIDPPYNTGHDFVYEDDFKDSIESYKQQTGQTDEEGQATRANAETSGRYHTDWLNMMLPRLLLARNLLRDDGVLFMSIDDCEVTNARKLCDEVFGESCFQGNLIWKTKTAAKGVPTLNMLVTNHDYVLVYAKNEFRFRGEDRDLSSFANLDDDPRGPWKADNMKSTVSTNVFEIVDPETGNCFTKNWAFSKESIDKMITEGRIIWPSDPSGTPRQKRFLCDMTNETTPLRTLIGEFQSETATNKLKELFSGKKIFDFPKQVELLKLLVLQSGAKDGVFMDFFSGSSTTAHAVMQLNAEDGGNRKFIMVQLPEVCAADSEAAKAGYKNICEIGKERIRRAGTKIKDENATTAPNLDVGFKVFKLDTSNLIPWNPNPEDLEQSLLAAVHNALVGRTTDDILYEVLLKCNLPLTLPIVKETCGTNTIHVIGDGALMICLDQTITSAVAEEMIRLRNEKYKPQVPMQVVFLDNGFTDKEKANAVVTLKQAGVEEKAIQSI